MSATEIQAAARPYAEGAYKHARARNELELWESMLGTLAGLAGSASLSLLLGADPRVTPPQREAALRALLDKALGGLSESTAATCFANFAGQLLGAGRLSAAAEIARQFTALRRREEGIIDIEISTAFALDYATLSRLEKALTRRFGATSARLTVAVDNSLGAGMVIKAGDQVIDGSLSAGIERLRGALARA